MFASHLRALKVPALGFFAFSAHHALAGPPLAIDDPGILDPTQWEIIGAVTGADCPSHTAIAASLSSIPNIAM